MSFIQFHSDSTVYVPICEPDLPTILKGWKKDKLGQILKFVVQLKIAVTSDTFLCPKKFSGIEKVKEFEI